jgi:hypothetical protein
MVGQIISAMLATCPINSAVFIYGLCVCFLFIHILKSTVVFIIRLCLKCSLESEDSVHTQAKDSWTWHPYIGFCLKSSMLERQRHSYCVQKTRGRCFCPPLPSMVCRMSGVYKPVEP